MKVLAIDTSSKLCSVAILEDTNLIKKLELDNGLTHSETLMPLIQQLLKECDLTLNNIDLLVSDIGPGSFTGIRIGVASCKAFSDSLNIPCVGISSLEVLAYNIKNDGIICSTIDCKNDNCYFALYELKNGLYNVLQEPCAMPVDDVLNLLGTQYSSNSISFVGDGISNEKLCNFYTNNADLNNFEKVPCSYLNIENLGIAGYRKFANRNKVGEDILPLYLKKPQAQIQLEKKLNKISKMSIEDLESIKNVLDSDFDNFWSYDVLKDELECENSYVVVAKNDENQIIGFACLKVILDEADIMNIVVRKPFRHNGIGSILLDNLISYSKNLNLKSVTLEVNENNLSAIHLYDKFSFDNLGIRKKYYNGESDAIIMSKQL